MGANVKLRDNCVSGADNEQFVGVKIDADGPKVYFPIGYQIPDSDDELREDICCLLDILYVLRKEKKLVTALPKQQPSELEEVSFPANAYIKIITDFIRSGQYYTEKDPKYKTDTRGKIVWPRTIREQTPYLQRNRSLVYTNFIVRTVTPNLDKQITQIHKNCVYEAFNKLGFLYAPSFSPEKPENCPNSEESIYILTEKLSSTFNDNEQNLFRAMIELLQFKGEKNLDQPCFFGVERFDRIWEKMIDKAFGIEGKNEFFPDTMWLLNGGNKKNVPLQPDSIMFYNKNYYILDAKYYHYGQDADLDDLPGSADINKQITYGEYAAKHLEKREKNFKKNNMLFNAFIMPYNMADNPIGLSSTVGKVGEAVGVWKKNQARFERIQGIVIDTRFLIKNYNHMPDYVKKELATAIKK